MAFLRRNAVALLAIFIALAGTGTAAERLITGADIADGTLRSIDIRDGSLTRADFAKGQAPRGARGPRGEPGSRGPAGPIPEQTPVMEMPLAYARVAADGTVVGGDAPVSHPVTGTYCAKLPDARWVQASSADATRSVAVAQTGDADCFVRVTVTDAAGVPADGPFNLLVRTG